MLLKTDKFAIKKALNPSEWAERNIVLPADNARPGPLSFRDSPFQSAFLDMVADPTVQRMTFQSAAQIGKTLTGTCIIGYYTAEKPMSQMMLHTSKDDMKKWLATKFEPFLAANPELASLYATPRGREGFNTQVLKDFRGGHFISAWSGGENSLRGMSAPIIVCDEVDGYEYTADQGHPVDLIWRRSATFGNKRKLIELSTPTVINESWIEASYLAGDMRRFWVICPKCSEPWVFEWEHVRYKSDDVDSARLHCPKCDEAYDDMGRIKMVRYAEMDGGGWIPKATTKRHRSFQLSALYSPLQRMSDIVQDYLDTGEDPNKLSTFHNTVLGETYEKVGETADAHELSSHCEDYPAPVPKDVKVLTAGIDVQGDRLEVEVVGWAAEETSWNIAYEAFYGDTSNPNDTCYHQINKFLRTAFGFEGGGQMFISCALIDSGFNTLSIYQYTRNQAGNTIPKVYACKGIHGWNKDVIRGSKATMTYKGYRPPLFSLGVDIIKRVIMQKLNIQGAGNPGYCHFPSERAEGEYFDQLTSETLMYDPRTGRRKWVKKDSGANEALDCRVYAYAALHVLKPDLNVPHALVGEGRKAITGFKHQVKTYQPS